jgi:putative transposase
LDKRIKLYQETKKSTSWINLANELVGLKKQPKYQFLKEVNSQTYQQTLKHQDKAFKSFFQKPKQFGFPQFKSRKGKQSITIPQHIQTNLESGYTSICKIGNIPTIFHRPLEGKIQHATISKTKAGNYFISFCCETKEAVEVKSVTPETTVGIDVGLKSFAILSTGTKINNPKFLKTSAVKVKHEQRKLSSKVKGSTARKKQQIRLAKVSEHVANQRKDFLQKLSHAIVSDNQTNAVVVEDLNIKGMMKNHKLAAAIADVGWSDFMRMLAYKCEWNGKSFFQIGRFEPSSKTCSVCGFVNHALTLENRTWECGGCGVQHDRDINAATNIRDIKLRELGLLKPQENLASGATPKQVKERPAEQIASGALLVDALSYCNDVGKYRAGLVPV